MSDFLRLSAAHENGRSPYILERAASEEAHLKREVLEAVTRRCQLIGVPRVDRRAGVYGANLTKVLSGRGKIRGHSLAKVSVKEQRTVTQEPCRL